MDAVDFEEYKKHYERLAYDHFPFSRLFSWDENGENEKINPDNRKHTVKYAMMIASEKFQSMFNIEKSFRENKGDIHHLEDDVERIFWALFRQEFPPEAELARNPEKYKSSVRQNLHKIREDLAKEKEKQQEEDRRRGAEKRYDKEQEYRKNIGEDEFNRRMEQEKHAKHSKGPKNDREYLEFIQWRKSEMAKAYSPYFSFHDQSEIVRPASGRIHVNPMNMNSSKTRVFKLENNDFNEMLHEILKMDKYKVALTMEEGGFSNVPMQYVLLDKGPKKVSGAQRSKIIEGTIELYAKHPDLGLLVAFNDKKNSFTMSYPGHFSHYMKHIDSYTGESMAPPFICHANILYTVRGNISAQIMIRDLPGENVTMTIRNFGQCNSSPLGIVSQIINPTSSIEQRLKDSIQMRHDNNKIDGIKIQSMIQKKVQNSATFVEQLQDLTKLFDSGHLSPEEYNAAKAKLLH
tara:strand:+ start:365 stop:1750 length:1386 start_codon:yes stop_codon:yes gene_type:complete